MSLRLKSLYLYLYAPGGAMGSPIDGIERVTMYVRVSVCPHRRGLATQIYS